MGIINAAPRQRRDEGRQMNVSHVLLGYPSGLSNDALQGPQYKRTPTSLLEFSAVAQERPDARPRVGAP